MYIDPMDVISPKRKIRDLEVIFNGGPDSFAISRLTWNKEDAYGIRWNGTKDDDEDVGYPKSRELGVWYILPYTIGKMLADAVEVVENDTVANKGTYLTSCLEALEEFKLVQNKEDIRKKMIERQNVNPSGKKKY